MNQEIQNSGVVEAFNEVQDSLFYSDYARRTLAEENPELYSYELNEFLNSYSHLDWHSFIVLILSNYFRIIAKGFFVCTSLSLPQIQRNEAKEKSTCGFIVLHTLIRYKISYFTNKYYIHAKY